MKGLFRGIFNTLEYYPPVFSLCCLKIEGTRYNFFPGLANYLAADYRDVKSTGLSQKWSHKESGKGIKILSRLFYLFIRFKFHINIVIKFLRAEILLYWNAGRPTVVLLLVLSGM